MANEPAAAVALASFVTELHAVDMAGGPPAGRAPLRELDAATSSAIEAARGFIDAAAAAAVWSQALVAPPWDEVPTWIHGDLMRPNLLVVDGRLDAVIDFGGVGVGARASVEAAYGLDAEAVEAIVLRVRFLAAAVPIRWYVLVDEAGVEVGADEDDWPLGWYERRELARVATWASRSFRRSRDRDGNECSLA